MPLPTRTNIQTLDYSGNGQPAAYLEAKSLSSGSLDYTLNAQPIFGTAPDGAGGQTLTPSLYTNTNSFYAGSVQATYALLPSLVTDGDQLYAPSVTATNPVIAGLYTNTNTFYAVSTAASNTLLPSLVTDGDQFYAATVSATYSLLAPLIPSGNVFYSATITGGVQPTPVITTGSLVRPRKKFRPALLWPLEDAPKDASITLAWLVAEAFVSVPIGIGEMNAEARVSPDYTKVETYLSNITARSSWNDPSDLELSLIAELLFD